MPTRAKSELQTGLDQLGLSVSSDAVDRLFDYLRLMQKWNRRFNLTAITDLDDMVRRHLLDSLSLSPYITGERVLDVGSGAGLPGIPLALQHPHTQFVLLDSNGRKTHFLRQAKINLDLANVSIENCRVEHYASRERIAIVLCRAFSDLAGLLHKTGHLVTGACTLLAMKGRYPRGELAAIPANFEVLAVDRLRVPGMDSERHLVRIIRQNRPGTEA